MRYPVIATLVSAAIMTTTSMPTTSMAAYAATSQSGPTSSFVDELADVGHDHGTVENLKVRIARGYVPDSARGVEPTKTETTKNGDLIRTVKHYADGSFTGTEAPDLAAVEQAAKAKTSGASPMDASSSGCRYSHSSGAAVWTGCQIKGWDATAYIRYRIDVQKVNGGSTTITRYYTPEVGGHLGSVSPLGFERTAPNEVRNSVQWVSPLGWPSATKVCQVTVASSGVQTVAFW